MKGDQNEMKFGRGMAFRRDRFSDDWPRGYLAVFRLVHWRLSLFSYRSSGYQPGTREQLDQKSGYSSKTKEFLSMLLVFEGFWSRVATDQCSWPKCMARECRMWPENESNSSVDVGRSGNMTKSRRGSRCEKIANTNHANERENERMMTGRHAKAQAAHQQDSRLVLTYSYPGLLCADHTRRSCPMDWRYSIRQLWLQTFFGFHRMRFEYSPGFTLLWSGILS